MSKLFKVVEIFDSINGEGLNAGKLATFIRLKGCNLRCNYCDTAWAITEDAPSTQMSIKAILDRVVAGGLDHVTLTGGEPLLAENHLDLLKALNDKGFKVDIETNGSMDIGAISSNKDLSKVALIMDYKSSGSGMNNKMNLENFHHLRRQDTVKFVLSSQEDMREALKVIQDYKLVSRTNIYFSPVFGRIEPEALVNFMKEHRLNGVTLQLQMHKIIWHPDQKGV